MIDRVALLNDCTGLMRRLEADLIARSHGATALPEAVAALREEFRKAKDAKRTAQNFEDWRTDYATQQAAAWILSVVFVRFLEDNELIDPPRIAGAGDRLKHARDQHEIYFRTHPTETDREYLLHVFHEVGKLPGGKEIFGKYNAVFEMPYWLSGDAAGEILKFFQQIDADTGALVHDFTDPEWDTRFLGDLYQDLSEAARKKYALLQTPEFVEEFILDRTLDPALDEFGLDAPAVTNANGEPITQPGFRMIDPACGSGHFLLGAFRRILDRWQRKEPGANVRQLVQRTLDSVNGVDLNPYAIAISRFRLLVAALMATGVRKLRDAPAFHFNLAAGDSLLHGSPGGEQQLLAFDPLSHHYCSEDIDALRRILCPKTFHAVVANPPYISVKDSILREAYRARYSSCHGRYVLTIPFMERVLSLACNDGLTGQITSNSFMKREFGAKLVEEFIPTVDLTHVIDTSGAYIPGHGTPTVILFARQRLPVSSTVRTVMGIQGEPSRPIAPSHGVVWHAIMDQVDRPGSESRFVSAADSLRAQFHKHPWSIGGGGASELKSELDERAVSMLGQMAESIGIMCFTLEDEAYFMASHVAKRKSIGASQRKAVFEGDDITDWSISSGYVSLFPYDQNLNPLKEIRREPWMLALWPYRSCLASSVMFGNVTKVESGLAWYEFGRLTKTKVNRPNTLAFAEIGTHNRFFLDTEGRLFSRSANLLQLPLTTDTSIYYRLLGLLNSSLANFWGRQVWFPKGGDQVDGSGARVSRTPWEDRLQRDSSKLQSFPLPRGLEQIEPLARKLARHSEDRLALNPYRALCDLGIDHLKDDCESKHDELLARLITLQEELDWYCYRLYGLIDEDLWDTDPPSIRLGERAFEILMARKLRDGELETTWFERHGSTPITEIPDGWPETYKRLVERRIDLVDTNSRIGLIETPECKRRWNIESWTTQLERALKSWLLDRLESYFDFDGRMNDEAKPTAKRPVALCSVAQLADIARRDPQFQEVGALYRGDSAFDVTQLVTDLVEEESVPHLPVLRYKAPGLRKREEWEKTWALQRHEDAIDARTDLPAGDPNYLTKDQATRLKKQEIGDIAVPPKYASGDFQKTHYWRLRGKLDVPKERWVSFPYCEGQDGTLMVAWAGYDHLQLAKAISAHYVDVQERFGGREDPRLIPLLASLIELLPWLKQWHNDVDPEFNMAMGDYFEGFIQEEARGLGKTIDEIRAWQPPQRTQRRTQRKRAAVDDE